jgi:ATP-binding protein involved in chromosome partitioning
VQGLVVRAGRAGFMLEVPASQAATYAPVREAAEKALAACRASTSPRWC